MAHRPASGDTCRASLGDLVQAGADPDVRARSDRTGKPPTTEGRCLAGDGPKALGAGRSGGDLVFSSAQVIQAQSG